MKFFANGIWTELLADLQDPRVVWQLVAIAVCVGIAWTVTWLARRSLKEHEQATLVGVGIRPLSAVFAPLLAAGLLLLVKPVLANWYNVSLLRLAIALLASSALIRAVFYVLRRIFARSGNVGSFLRMFETVFALLIWVAVAAWITGLWPQLLGFFDETLIPIGRHKVSLLVVVQAVASVAATLLLALWIGALLEERLMRVETMHSSLRAVMARAVRALLILVAVLLSLSLVGIDLTVLSVFGGALGVGLGLGLQKIAGSYFAGFVILLERSLALGDMVKVDQHQGQVTRISSRYTVLRGPDGAETVVPNDMLVSQVVQNYSLTDRKVRVASNVTVGYETDLDLLFPLLSATVANVTRVCAEPAPLVLLTRFGADGLDLEIGYWLEDPENGRGNLTSDVNMAIWKVLKDNKVNIPYPQRDIRIVSGDQTAPEAARVVLGKAAPLDDLA
ncbi:mechanosensitive ion channel family protein [Lacisediminimonas sp.]|uniref:mechanosensitive ion channel family protein n=1 Tax=Lacisediminimonas sp. TaxID=3060582 RepID=UPI00271ED5FD|nr:mechanosensitive ion channel domain-containing protein [Lacisediminimonas sp.]MDO8300834.1 mechanosensitive ion channel [Lacisediminimonas sp.]